MEGVLGGLESPLGALVPKGPSPSGDVLRQRIRCKSEGGCASSGARDDGQERAKEATAALTGTSTRYATPLERLGQRSLD